MEGHSYEICQKWHFVPCSGTNKMYRIVGCNLVTTVSRKTIIEWKKIVKATGDVKAKENYHKPHRRIIKETDRFKKFIEQNCSKSAKELALAWHQKISASAIVRFLKKLGYTYKKSLYPSKKGGWSQK